MSNRPQFKSVLPVLLLLFAVGCHVTPPRRASAGSENSSKRSVASHNSPEIVTGALSASTASALAKLPLRCIDAEYPNKPDHVANALTDVRNPSAMHPAFYGCFDWHSSVHGHWMLVRLLRLFPALPEAAEIRAVLERHLTTSNILAEVRYLEQPNRTSFERTYGWAWLLKLAQECRESPDPQAQQWAGNLQPLADALVKRYRDFLPKQHYAIRTGVHPNTAFGLAFALDYARSSGMADFEAALVERARFYFLADRGYPAQWEPGGEDFFSPGLMEADLMRRVLAPDKFADWFGRFLPRLQSGDYGNLLNPAVVTDRTDPKLVHLDGLNLSRAWCLKGIAGALPAESSVRGLLLKSATTHLKATLPHVTTGHYEGEHWLASFALMALE